MSGLLPPLLALALAPLLPAIIARVKAFFAGRKGPPLLQTYFDLARLLQKGAVYSRTTSWVFRLAPPAGLACALTALALVPFGGLPAPLPFAGDFLLLAGIFGLLRFLTVAAALDTGSSFEGMGASREVLIAVLAEVGFFLVLAGVVRQSGSLSLSKLAAGRPLALWATSTPLLALLLVALILLALAENSRMPVDDPNTHLELTMIHEVMILDHSGPDLAFILYGATLKLWTMGALILALLLPFHSGNPGLDLAAGLAGMAAFAVLIGVIESTTARLPMLRVPQFLALAAGLAALALLVGG